MSVSVGEHFENPMDARQVKLGCPYCNALIVANLPYRPTAEKRMEAIKAVIDEHRKVCVGADALQGRTYSITYPRK